MLNNAMKEHMKNIVRAWAVLAIATVVLAGCGGKDAEVEKKAASTGFSAEAAAELSRMNLTPDEMASVAEAKHGGLDDASILKMVKVVHERDLKFDLGMALQIFKQQGIGSTVLIQLVEMGAIPRWADDIRALKDAKVEDVTIVEMAKLRFVEKKEMLSGSEYGQLKGYGLSDAGLLAFARKGGTQAQMQTLSKDLALGKAEPEALKAIGM